METSLKEENWPVGVRCRCCYEICSSGPKLRQADASNNTTEMYCDILHLTFNLQLCKLEHEYVCWECAGKLRDASHFKRLVQETEQRHLQHLAGTSSQTDHITSSEVILKMETPDEENWETDYLDTEDYIDIPITPKDEVKCESSPDAGVFRPADRKLKLLLSKKKRVIDLLLAGKPDPSAPASHNISLTGRSTLRKMSEGKVKRLKSGSLESQMVKSKSRAARSKIKMSVDTLLKALTSKPAVNIKIKSKHSKNKMHRDALKVNLLPVSLVDGNRRQERQIIKKNSINVVRFTTACPFIHYHSTFKCVFCKDTFYTFDPLRDHVRRAHVDISEEVKKLPSFKDLLHIDISDLKCRKCEENFTDVKSVKRHLINEHKIKINPKHADDVIEFKLYGKGSFKCHLCPMDFHVFRNLSLHMNEHFQNYMCNICGKPFISAVRCKTHEQAHQTGSYPCSRCDKVFNSVNARNVHTVEHRSTRYRCPQCSEKFEKYLDRTVHMSEVHQITQRFVCTHPHCGKEFIHKPQFSAHTKSHMQKEKKVECSECGMRFINNYALNKHIVTHTGERPYQCKVCGKRYGRTNTLREHMRIHENDRRHVCPECGQAFVQKCSLKGHMKSRHPLAITY